MRKKTTADKLRHIRKKHVLTQAELAEKIGWTISSIQKWEQGISEPSKRARKDLDREFPGWDVAHDR